MSGSLGFDYSSSRAKQQSTSDSSSYGYSGAVSGDQSVSGSESIGGGSSTTTQGVFGADLFQQLYGRAATAAGGVALQAPELSDAAKQLFTGGSAFLQTLGGNAGSNYLEGRVAGENPAVEQVIASMRRDAGTLFSEELNPAITSRAVAGGTLGGGRQGVAQGIAQGKVVDSLIRASADVRMQDVAARDTAAMQLANNSVAAASTGLNALPGMLDIMERGHNAELAPYSSLAGILGGPTVLSQSEASDFSRATSQSIAEAFSRSFGEQAARSTSQSTGSSRSKGWGFDSSFSMMNMGGG